MAIHSSILAWKIAWTEDSPWGRKESDTTERLHFLSFQVIQCSAWASNREQEAGSPDFYQFSSVQSLSRV